MPTAKYVYWEQGVFGTSKSESKMQRFESIEEAAEEVRWLRERIAQTEALRKRMTKYNAAFCRHWQAKIKAIVEAYGNQVYRIGVDA